MDNEVRAYRSVYVLGVGVLLAGLTFGLIAGCPATVPGDGNVDNDNVTGNDNDNVPDGGDGNPPAEFTNANLARGGALYDEWWEVTDADEPTTDHPRWAARPDQQSNTRTGADTWRCKECHGWDYRGVDGAYATGSHRTGFPGIFGTTLSAQEVFDAVKDDHGYGAAGLSDADIWDLAKFVLEGQIDTDDIIGADGAFLGVADAGQTLFNSGIGSPIGCSICHGADGLTPPPGAPADYSDFVGTIANDNPWEFQHKVRFGQPGSSMPAAASGDATSQDVADLGAYAQTLPIE